MSESITNWAIINRCQEWLKATRQERWDVDGKAVAEVGNALFHLATLALEDMKFLARMEDAGLGHCAGPQVRRLMEASTVAWDMQTHCDKSIADEVFNAWDSGSALSQDRISKSRKRLKGENGKVEQNIQKAWEIYNAESHFNLRERQLPAQGQQCVRHGIAMGYMVINEFALFRSEHLPSVHRTDTTSNAEALLDETGRIFVEQLNVLATSQMEQTTIRPYTNDLRIHNPPSSQPERKLMTTNQGQMVSRLLELALERGAIRYGDFTLSSGRKSFYYFDGRLLSLDPEGAYLLGHSLLPLIKDAGVGAVGGPTLGADPIVAAVATASWENGTPVPAFIVRKEAKGYGMGQMIEGPLPAAGTSVAIVDDACTTGGSLFHAIDAAEAAGYRIGLVLAALDRNEGGSDAIRQRGYRFECLLTAGADGQIRPA